MKRETEEFIEKIKTDLKESMSEHRYTHSVNVMDKAIDLAKIYGEDEDEAAIAGLLHDIAKEIPDEEAFEIAKENNIEFDEIERINTSLIHGKMGAWLAYKKYVVNQRIQNAICYHTETNENMDMLAKIIFVADKIEDGRNPDNVDIESQRKLAEEDIDSAIIFIIGETMKKLIAKGKLIHTAEICTRNKLISEKLKKDNAK